MPQKPKWARLPKDKLLKLRICDLDLKLEDSILAPRIEQLGRELEHKGIRFRPHFWLSDDWYCPDGIPGISIPFFLAHPRLRRLEYEFMMEIEGGDKSWCMKLLRHETAHALLNAYKLDQRRDWRQTFGRPNATYPDTYLPRPYSRDFVINLPNWYAQAHPHEDWAETFAVWLNPNFNWRRRYKDWNALDKLEYVDRLMHEIKQKQPKLRNRKTDYPVEKIRTTLGEFYQHKVALYGVDSLEFFDHDLRKLFVSAEDSPEGEKASRFLRRLKPQIIDIVERWTREYKYRINEVLKDMIKRCDKLNLKAPVNHVDVLPEMTAYVTMLVAGKMHSGGFRISL